MFCFYHTIRLHSTHFCIMKISNKREFQQIAFNYSSDIDFKDFMNFCKKCTWNSFSFLVIDVTFASDNLSRSWENLLERIWRLIMTIYDKIRDRKNYNMILREKQQKHQHYHQVKLINMNILQMKKYYLLIKG